MRTGRVVALGVAALGIVLAIAVTRPTDPEGDPEAAFSPERPSELSAVRAGRLAPSRRRGYALVWAVGDGADGSDAAKALARRIAASNPDWFLYLGDVYNSGTPREFVRNYHAVYGRLASRTAPTLGDNEWPNRRHGFDAYWTRITGKRPRRFYSFTVAGWKVLSVTSEEPSNRRQLRWLRSQLRSPGTCRLAFWHRARYSAGHYDDDDELAPLWSALRGRATIVVNAHDHNMQRFRPLNGITTFISGAGGSTRYEVERDPRLAFANGTSGGALRLELRPGSARYAFVTTGGRTLDAGTIRCIPERR